MIYRGSIIILDDDGNDVFEQELSQDEIIATLLAALPDTDAILEETDTPHEVEEPTAVIVGKPCCGSKQARHKKSCQKFGSGTRPALDDGEIVEVRECCGSSTHGRHRAACPQAGKTPKPENRRTVDNRRPFSEPTYRIVKDMLDEEGRDVDGISSEKGLDLEEVRRCNLSDDFADYLGIA